MKTTKQLLCVGGLLLAGAVAQAQGDPDLIDVTSLEQLDAMRYDLDGDGVVDDAANATAYETAFPSLLLRRYEGYELTTNLDFEDAASYAASDRNDAWVDPDSGGTTDTEGWEPIGDFSSSFIAIFEGNDNTISNLYINRSVGDVGLFGYLGSSGEVRHLGIEGGSVTGANYVGGLVGRNDGTISACSATGNAEATATIGNAFAGGLVGSSSGTINACYATGNAEANATTDRAYAHAGGLVGSGGPISGCYATGNATAEAAASAYAGGLVGRHYDTISGCYATGNATAEAAASAYAGGLVGRHYDTISGCYATGNAEATNNGTGNAYAGGFVGSGRNITACYSIGDATATGNTTFIGGFEGYSDGRISKSYFDHETSNRPETDIGAQATSDLQSPTDYTGIYQGWNLDLDNDSSRDDPWNFGTNAEYPVLKIVTLDLNSSPSLPDPDPPTPAPTPLSVIFNVPNPTAASGNAQVYPNPASQYVQFANLTPGRVYLYKIYTYSGILLRSDAVQSDEVIDISTLEAGQHLLVLQDDASREVLRSSLLIE